ncbi:starch synthase (maltosyl-transferring) [Candidatus Planktophila vernalis]|uniref:starch synthase (maltosyl-transferring) n=1 Tax=Candidatus Planktophila vernalis TaxID=1884907 RepID=A0A249KS43_9ACTN|nr:alpha-1,4-glucan--maltose-1-phosphate maltosyltransferase [Candidatus Planktophila vernalis]ASY19622.1 starch synthase (maltosyl-transferring) [Candidatus Planktophila vernalis]
MISRIAISDISPAVYFGGEFLPVKAAAGETIQVSATAVIEGHEKLGAQVALHDSKGKVVSRADMKETWPGTNRYEGSITIPAQGDYFFVVEADSTSQYRTVYGSTEKYPIRADRERALSGAWYEFFPRSEGAVKNADGTITSGTFVSATKRLPAVASMGFDVLYLPPIHPIGVAHRKGPNNSLTAGPNDPGVPWAIGNSDGGHDAINPELGTMKDFENFVAAAKKAGLEIALDLALQTSPDHPWVKSNPQWFNKRADGTIAYAENPPKKYQDIYPINFDDDYEGVRDEVLRIIRLWVSKGVKIFRVDNPHTKPVHFWQDLLDIVRRESPEVIFLAEAFTAPAMMHALGKAGFHQSYTYFTWRTSKSELTEYGREVAQQTSAFFRPNFWVNTPDINPFHLQSGNPAMFALRAVLASTLTPSWGMYAGYEIYEHRPFKEGGEEYLDSEKYEIKVRDWDGATKKGLTLAPFITQLNAIRKANPALHQLRNLVFHNTESEAIIAYSKREGKNLVLVVVNLDPSFAQGTIVHWDMNALGLEGTFAVKDLLDGKSFDWSEHQFIQLDPTRPVGKVAHICQVKL